MGSSNKVWRGRNNRPPFAIGDFVTPKPGIRHYASPKQHDWRHGQYRRVECVEYDEFQDRWSLCVNNPVTGRISRYTPFNFTIETPSASCPIHEEKPMSYFQRTKFFAVKLNTNTWDDVDAVGGTSIPVRVLNGGINLNGGLHLADVNDDYDKDVNHYDTTELRDHKSQALADVQAIVKAGERWIVCQTVCMVEGEPPRPPVKITEFR